MCYGNDLCEDPNIGKLIKHNICGCEGVQNLEFCVKLCNLIENRIGHENVKF